MGSFRSDLRRASEISGLFPFRARLFNRCLLAGVSFARAARLGRGRALRGIDSSRVRSLRKKKFVLPMGILRSWPKSYCCASHGFLCPVLPVECFSIQRSRMEAGRRDLLFRHSAGAMGESGGTSARFVGLGSYMEACRRCTCFF